MCYTVKYLTEKALRRAQHYGVQEDIDAFRRELEERFEEFYQVSGFAHPELLIYPNSTPFKPMPARWGLIPHWARGEEKAFSQWNKTINARGETIFELPSFRDAAKHKRCIVPLAGFYEYHHHKGQAYPFYIERADGEPMYVGGLWSDWINKQTGELLNTFTIVTTKGNQLLSKIHNNPKLKEPRMPLILPDESVDDWLQPINCDSDQRRVQELLVPNESIKLNAHTVQKLQGKEALGNVPEASDYYHYEELEQ